MPAEFDITGKVVFITGAGHGIGKGIAQVLAEAGGDIALNALRPTYVEGTLRHQKNGCEEPDTPWRARTARMVFNSSCERLMPTASPNTLAYSSRPDPERMDGPDQLAAKLAT